MTQSRTGSLVEALINILIGYWINFFMNLVILNGVFHLGVTLTENVLIGVLFTGVSLVRQYAIRRWFATSIHSFANRFGGA